MGVYDEGALGRTLLSLASTIHSLGEGSMVADVPDCLTVFAFWPWRGSGVSRLLVTSFTPLTCRKAYRTSQSCHEAASCSMATQNLQMDGETSAAGVDERSNLLVSC